MQTAVPDFKKLPVSERIQLVEDIWDSIAEDTSATSLLLSAEDTAELQRRLRAHQADPDTSIPWEQVRASLFHSRVPGE